MESLEREWLVLVVKYALIYEYLEKKGCKIPIRDVWIAACCMADGGTILTRDNHFNNVEQIEKIVLDY